MAEFDDNDSNNFCDDSNFTFDSTWKYIAEIIIILCSIYVFVDAIRHKYKRQVPGKLMIGRTLVDLLWAVSFFYMALNIKCIDIKNNPSTCRAFGTCFTFLFLLSLMYFGGICWDMYFTLVNPFRKPVSDSWQLHLVAIIVSAIVAFIPCLNKQYQYRQDYQICWTENTSGTPSIANIIILYVPLIAVIVGGLGITIWAVFRLKQRMLEETFELRWSVIKRQIAIVGLFTINYVAAGCIWIPIVLITYKNSYDDNKYGAVPVHQPYLLSVTIVLTNIFDLIAWIAKDTVESCNVFKNPIKNIISSSSSSSSNSNSNVIIAYNISSKKVKKVKKNHKSTPNSSINRDEKTEPLLNKTTTPTPTPSSLQYTLNSNTNTTNDLNYSLESNNTTSSLNVKTDTKQNKNKKVPNLSNALRREVIVFITHGLAQAVKRTAKETQQTQSHAALDVWDADFDHAVYSNRRSQKSKSDLQSKFIF